MCNMDLKTFLSERRGRSSSLARELGVSSVMVSQWVVGRKLVPAERCPSIERATQGVVRCEDLRPDVDWAYLRQSGSNQPQQSEVA